MKDAKSRGKLTEYELLTYKGRKICDEFELGAGYCGSCPIETHIEQVRDKKSWVQFLLSEWEKVGRNGYVDNDYRTRVGILEEKLKLKEGLLNERRKE